MSHFMPKPEAAVLGGPRHHRPGGRLLGDGLHVGEVGVDGLVELLQEAEGLEVLVAAVLVRDPLARLAGVVEVEHRGHGVDPEPVDVVAVEPEVGARQQEAPHLVAAVVEDRAVPVGVVALARVGVLVEVGAVEVARGRARRSGSATGTQSRITPMPAWCSVSMRNMRSCGRAEPRRWGRSSRWSGSPTSRRTGAR